MFWEEKINLVKKKFSDKEFSVPHVNRKDILRKIETAFIKRNKDYYDLNNPNRSFSNWWNNINANFESPTKSNFNLLLESTLSKDETYWLGFEFTNGKILIYKSNIEALCYLCAIGQTWSQTFHIIHLKFDFLMSLKITETHLKIKTSGNPLLIKKLKNSL